jgi:hypothetical protein
MPSSMISGRPWIVPRSVDLHFWPSSTPNLQCQSTWKLCPSTNTQLLYCENLKCLCEIWRTQPKGVLSRVWPRVDQGWPKGVIGDVFEVMAQVDRRLTKVNTVDRFIRVNKPDWKPGASQPTPLKQNLVPRFDNKIRATLSNKIRVTRWKTYSLIFLGSENSDREKDTWCSPHCLNAVHEEAGDEYVHGRLKEDKLRRRCRGTSLQASNGGTQTSPRIEAWSAMQAGVLLSVFVRASYGGCRQRRLNSSLGESAVQRQRWASGGLTKTSRRGKQERRHCRARKQARLGNGNTTGGFPFS